MEIMGPRARLAKHVARWALVGVAGLIVLAALFTLAVNLLILHETEPFVVNEPAAVPPASVVIVPSGSIRPDGIPTPLAVDRMATAVRLYRDGKAKALYLSGYPEQVRFMVAYAKANGVPESDVLADPAGSTTYETMANALTSLGARTALVSTQRYHLSRAVYITRSLGIDAVGVPADIQSDPDRRYNTVREWGARVKAFLEVHF